MKWIVIAALGLVFSTIGAGVSCYLKGTSTTKTGMKKVLSANILTMVTVLIAGASFVVPDVVMAASTGALTQADSIALLSAALSTGLACLGAGYAVGVVGVSAIGAILEDSKSMGKSLIFVGLSEGIAIYGLIISIMILQRV